MANKSYDDFEPYCKWRSEEKQDTLEITLQGFKKDQLKVQVSSVAVLTISGESPVDETRSNRFRKEINVSKYKTDEIHAKFSGGILYITMNKKIPSSTPQRQPTLPQKVQENEKPNQQVSQEGKERKCTLEAKELGNGSSLAPMTIQPKATGMTSSVLGLEVSGETALKLGALAVVVVVVVSIGAYVAYKYLHCQASNFKD